MIYKNLTVFAMLAACATASSEHIARHRQFRGVQSRKGNVLAKQEYDERPTAGRGYHSDDSYDKDSYEEDSYDEDDKYYKKPKKYGHDEDDSHDDDEDNDDYGKKTRKYGHDDSKDHSDDEGYSDY